MSVGLVVVLACAGQIPGDVTGTGSISPSLDEGLTATAAPDLADMPLSDEELALIEALGEEAPPPEMRTWPSAEGLLPEPMRIFDGASARTVGERINRGVTLTEIRRAYASGDSAVMRGRSGHRVALTLDGFPLHNPLTSIRGPTYLSSVDPWSLQEIQAQTSSQLITAPRAASGAIALKSFEPRMSPGFETVASTFARSSDRGVAAHGAVDGATDFGAVRLSGRYSDFRALRVPDTGDVGSNIHQTGSASLRGRILGTSADDWILRFGGDFERLIGVARPDLGAPAATDRRRDRNLAFLRFATGDDELGFELSAAGQRFANDRTRFAVSSTSEEAITAYLSTLLRLDLGSGFQAFGGGDLDSGNADGEEIGGNSLATGGFLGLGFDRGILGLKASTRFQHSEADLEIPTTRSVDADELLAELRGRLQIIGPFALQTSAFREMHTPTVRDLADAADVLDPEKVWGLEGGVLVEHLLLQGGVTVFVNWVRDGIEPNTSGALVNIGNERLYGVETHFQAYPTRRITLRGAASLTDSNISATDDPAEGVPGLTVRGSARYELGIREAYFEGMVRGSLVRDRVHPYDALLFGAVARNRFGYLTASLRAGVYVGAGFDLSLALENFLDSDVAIYGSTYPESGIDLTVGLTHRFDAGALD